MAENLKRFTDLGETIFQRFSLSISLPTGDYQADPKREILLRGVRQNILQSSRGRILLFCYLGISKITKTRPPPPLLPQQILENTLIPRLDDLLTAQIMLLIRS